MKAPNGMKTSSNIKGMIPQNISEHNLILARHGETAMNADGDKVRGWKDIPLNSKGKEEAKVLGDKLKDVKFDAIISSDLKRTRETAEIISKETGKPILAFTKGLRPWDVGKFAGIESHKVLPMMQEHIKNPDKVVEGGESFNSFKKRYLDEIGHIMKLGKTILIVSHHRNNVLLDAWQSAGEQPDYSIDDKKLMEAGIPPGGFKVYKLKI